MIYIVTANECYYPQFGLENVVYSGKNFDDAVNCYNQHRIKDVIMYMYEMNVDTCEFTDISP